MSIEKPKVEKSESKEDEQEKELTPEGIEELGDDMGQYTAGLKESIEDIKKELEIRADDERAEELREILEELEEEYGKLKRTVNKIEAGDFDGEFTKKKWEGEE